jgi:flagellar biosynthesis protein FlhF
MYEQQPEREMKLKSYYAGNVAAALGMARRELGSEAILVQSRKTDARSRHLGEVEVVCALLPESGDAAPGAAPEPVQASVAAEPKRAPRSPDLDRLSREVTDIKKQMERLASTLTRSGAGLSALSSDPGLCDIFTRLLTADLEAGLARDIVARIAEAVGAGSAENAASRLDALLIEQLERVIRVDPTVGRDGSKRRVVALVGPPGSGKTSALVKLAARFGLGVRRPTHVFSLDALRVAAAEQLRSYAAILGIGFHLVDDPARLGQALDEHSRGELALIDTPGFGPADREATEELAAALARRPEIEVQLVAPATMKAADLERMTEQYRCFNAAKLLITRIDETDTFGTTLSAAIRGGLPISFLSSGQSIPEDLVPASINRLTGLLLGLNAPTLAGAAAA